MSFENWQKFVEETTAILQAEKTQNAGSRRKRTDRRTPARNTGTTGHASQRKYK